MWLHPIGSVASQETTQKKCGTHSRLPTDIALALLAELRNIARPVALLTGAMNDRLNGCQTLPLDELKGLIPRQPLVHLAVTRIQTGHSVAPSTMDQLTRFYELLFSDLRAMHPSTDPLVALSPPEQILLCHKWRMICDRGLIAIYEVCRLELGPEMIDPLAPIEVLCGALRDARSGLGLLHDGPIDGTIPC